MYIGVHVKYRYCCQILIKLEFSQQIFESSSNIKFHENPSSESRDFPCGHRDRERETDRQTDMTELIFAFRNFANPRLYLLHFAFVLQ
jgi:hypothetical protein